MRVLRQEDVNAGWGEPEAARTGPGGGIRGGRTFPPPQALLTLPGVVTHPPEEQGVQEEPVVPYQYPPESWADPPGGQPSHAPADRPAPKGEFRRRSRFSTLM